MAEKETGINANDKALASAECAESDGRRRVVIANVSPQTDCGRFAVKRVLGQKVVVEADIFADGFDAIAAIVKFRRSHDGQWRESPMLHRENDRWRGEFTVEEVGSWVYTLEAWVDYFESWRRVLAKKVQAGQDVDAELMRGAAMMEEAFARAKGDGAAALKRTVATLRSERREEDRIAAALDEAVLRAFGGCAERRYVSTFDKELCVTVESDLARFSSWYEMFPRSCSPKEGGHGTLRDAESLIPYISDMGFDIVYLPPVHPIGRTNRKGRNNSPEAAAQDVGSPWAIGAQEGGHRSIHPLLGTMEDFRSFRRRAEEQGLAVALDLAFQCSPDHPDVRQHPEWFKKRADGGIHYAENPPKKYEDIYPYDFECADWRGLWEEMLGVVRFWMAEGIHIFRVDNPHTKPFTFWEWLISRARSIRPDVLFLSEAFTRPKVMYRLGKAGFSQSYTYFTWRNTKSELIDYCNEIFLSDVREFFRPNFWPNTPDILPEYLQCGGRPAFFARLVLAATLSGNYGVYGPAFELCEAQPLVWGTEEYLHAEKYEIRRWEIGAGHSLSPLITSVNRIRRENPALREDRSLRFLPIDNDQLICYSKQTEDRSNVIVVVVNLDPKHRQSGFVEIPLQDLGLDPTSPYQMHDLLSDARYLWTGARNYVELDPKVASAHIFRLRRKVRTEQDFDYYM